jgi:hypothetical protein
VIAESLRAWGAAPRVLADVFGTDDADTSRRQSTRSARATWARVSSGTSSLPAVSGRCTGSSSPTLAASVEELLAAPAVQSRRARSLRSGAARPARQQRAL